MSVSYKELSFEAVASSPQPKNTMVYKNSIAVLCALMRDGLELQKSNCKPDLPAHLGPVADKVIETRSMDYLTAINQRLMAKISVPQAAAVSLSIGKMNLLNADSDGKPKLHSFDLQPMETDQSTSSLAENKFRKLSLDSSVEKAKEDIEINASINEIAIPQSSTNNSRENTCKDHRPIRVSMNLGGVEYSGMLVALNCSSSTRRGL